MKNAETQDEGDNGQISATISEFETKIEILSNENERLTNCIQAKEQSIQKLQMELKSLKSTYEKQDAMTDEEHTSELEVLKNEIDRLNRALQFKNEECTESKGAPKFEENKA